VVRLRRDRDRAPELGSMPYQHPWFQAGRRRRLWREEARNGSDDWRADLWRLGGWAKPR